MKLPCSWLKELSGLDWSPDEMAQKLTQSGSAAVVEKLSPDHFKNVVIGQVIKLERHPNADKLKVAEVDTGDAVHTVICGAPNCEKGQKVVVALPGARLRGEFQVSEINMRGVKSAGMICAEDELGLSDDHSGIIVLEDDAPPGRPVYEYLGLDDAVLDFEITPNRPDCLCAVGIARELAVLAHKDFKFESAFPPEIEEKASDLVSVAIDDPAACPRYAARVIKNIKIGPSPWWLRKRLTACGVRPINNIVDITNYVMLETNHPLHAFDYDRFGSKEIIVRRAGEDEKFTTLDGQEHTLDNAVLLITNGRKGVAAAGVMGGLESEVTDTTTTVLLEAACFSPSVIRKSARKLGTASESSYRFERGVDPDGVVKAAERAAALIAELAGGRVLSGVVDNYAGKIEPVRIELRPERVKKLLGLDIQVSFMEATLRGLGLDVESGSILKITVPTFRPDITREIDLIEEIARIYGLDNIPVTRRNAGPLFTPTHRRDTIKDEIRNIVTGLGFEETLGSGLAHPDRMIKIDNTIEPVRILNPLSDEFAVMRSRMLYSLLLSAGNNIRHRNMDVKIFEIGRVYLKENSGYGEPEYFGCLVTGRREDVYWKAKREESDLFEIKGAVAALTDSLGLGAISLEPAAGPGYDPDQSYEIIAGDGTLGQIGCVDRNVCRMFDIKQDCFAAELKLDMLIKLHRGILPFRPLPKYPASGRDIAVVVDNDVPAAKLLEEITATGGELVESVEIFDLFAGDPVPEGKKSLAFSVSYRSADKTLEDVEVDRVHNRIVAHLKEKYKARLRE